MNSRQQANRQKAQEIILALKRLNFTFADIAAEATDARKKIEGRYAAPLHSSTLTRIMDDRGNRDWTVSDKIVKALEAAARNLYQDLFTRLLLSVKDSAAVTDLTARSPLSTNPVELEPVKTAVLRAVAALLAGQPVDVELPARVVGAVLCLGDKDSNIAVVVADNRLSGAERRKVLTHELQHLLTRLSKVEDSSRTPEPEIEF